MLNDALGDAGDFEDPPIQGSRNSNWTGSGCAAVGKDVPNVPNSPVRC